MMQSSAKKIREKGKRVSERMRVHREHAASHNKEIESVHAHKSQCLCGPMLRRMT